MKSELGQLLVEVKIAQAEARRTKLIFSKPEVYERVLNAHSQLIGFLDKQSIGNIEKLCK